MAVVVGGSFIVKKKPYKLWDSFVLLRLKEREMT